MRDDFSGWYASMSFNDDEGHAEKRLTAIDALIKDAPRRTFESLVRLAFRLKAQMTAQEIAEIRNALTGELSPPADEELSMLAASALARGMQSENSSGPLVAIMVATASCGSLRALRQPMDLAGMSETAVRKFAESSRRRPTLTPTKPLTRSLDKADVESALALTSGGDPAAGIKALAGSIDKALSALARRQTLVENEFQNYTQLQDEELDILWWLEGGYCTDLDNAFADLPVEQRSLGIARELAALTKVLPGPTSVQSLFVRASVGGAPPRSIDDAIQGMSVLWLNTVLGQIDKSVISPVTTPIIFAMSRRQELEGAEGWAPAWSKLTAIDQGLELDPLRLAELTYREFLLAYLG